MKLFLHQKIRIGEECADLLVKYQTATVNMLNLQIEKITQFIEEKTLFLVSVGSEIHSYSTEEFSTKVKYFSVTNSEEYTVSSTSRSHSESIWQIQ